MKLWNTVADHSGFVMLLAMAALIVIWITTDFGRDRELPGDALRRELNEATCVWWTRYNVCVCKVSYGPWGFVAAPVVCDMEDE